MRRYMWFVCEFSPWNWRPGALVEGIELRVHVCFRIVYSSDNIIVAMMMRVRRCQPVVCLFAHIPRTAFMADFPTSVLLRSLFIAQPNVVDVAELFEHYSPDFKDNPIKDVSPRKTTSWVGTLQNWQFWCRIRNSVVGRVGIQWICT